jgi:hypothetical protein
MEGEALRPCGEKAASASGRRQVRSLGHRGAQARTPDIMPHVRPSGPMSIGSMSRDRERRRQCGCGKSRIRSTSSRGVLVLSTRHGHVSLVAGGASEWEKLQEKERSATVNRIGRGIWRRAYFHAI